MIHLLAFISQCKKICLLSVLLPSLCSIAIVVCNWDIRMTSNPSHTLSFSYIMDCFPGSLSRRRSDSWPKLRKLGVRSDVGLGLSLYAVPLLQFGSQRSEEVGLEHQSKVVARMVIKTVNDEEGTNSRHPE